MQVWWKNLLMCAGNRDTSVICAPEWQELMNHTYRHRENDINEQRRRREGENHTFQILNKEIKQLCNKLLARHPRQQHAEKIRSLIRCHAESCLPAEICMYAKMPLMFKIWSVKNKAYTVISLRTCQTFCVQTEVQSSWYFVHFLLVQTNDACVSWRCQITVAEKCMHHSHYYFVEIKVIFVRRKTAICSVLPSLMTHCWLYIVTLCST